MGNPLAIAVTADVIDFTTKMAVLKAESGAAGSALRDLAKEAAAAGANISSQLSAQLVDAGEKAAAATQRLNALRVEQKRLMEDQQGGVLTGLKDSIEGMLSPITSVTSNLAGIGEAVAAAFAIERIAEWAKSVAEAGAQVLHLSQQLGLSTEQVSTFGFAASAVGLSIDQAATAMEQLEKNMSVAERGTGKQAEAFKALGIEASELKNMSLDQVMLRIAEAFSKSADGPDKTAIAMALMGRAAAVMIPVLNRGTEGWQEFAQQASEAGVVLRGPAAEGMEESAEGMNRLGQSTKGFGISLFETFKPAIDATVNGLTQLIQAMNDSIRSGGVMADIIKILAIPFNTLLISIRTVVSALVELFLMEQLAVKVAGDLGQGNFSAAAEHISDGWKAMKAEAVDYFATVHRLATNEGSTLGPARTGRRDQDLGDTESGKPKLDASQLNTSAQQGTELEAFRTMLAEKRAVLTEHGASEIAILRTEVAAWQDEAKKVELTEKEKLDVARASATARTQLAKAERSEILRLDEQAVVQAPKDSEARLVALRNEIADAKRLFGEKSAEALRAENQYTEAVRAQTLERVNIQAKADNDQIAAIGKSLSAQIANEDSLVKTFRISAAERTNILVAAAEEAKEKQLALIDDELRAYEANDLTRTTQYQAAEDKRTAILRDAEDKRQAIVNRGAEMQQAQNERVASSWAKSFDPVSSAFDSSMRDMLAGRATFNDASRNFAAQWVQGELAADARALISKLALFAAESAGFINKEAAEQVASKQTSGGLLFDLIFRRNAEVAGDAASVTSHTAAETAKTAASTSGAAARTAVSQAETGGSFLSRIADALSSWLGFESAKTGATIAGATSRETAETTADAAGLAQSVAMGFAQIQIDAAVAAAGAMAAISAIPFIGPELAPEVAAATYAETMGWAAGLGGGVALEVGAWDIPKTMQATLHKGETVVPADFASGLRSSGTLGKGGAGAGQQTINVTVNAQHDGAMSGEDIAFLVGREIRNANPSLVRNSGW